MFREILILTCQGHPTTERFLICQKFSDGFLYALEAFLVNLELP